MEATETKISKLIKAVKVALHRTVKNGENQLNGSGNVYGTSARKHSINLKCIY